MTMCHPIPIESLLSRRVMMVQPFSLHRLLATTTLLPATRIKHNKSIRITTASGNKNGIFKRSNRRPMRCGMCIHNCIMEEREWEVSFSNDLPPPPPDRNNSPLLWKEFLESTNQPRQRVPVVEVPGIVSMSYTLIHPMSRRELVSTVSNRPLFYPCGPNLPMLRRQRQH